MQCIHYAYKLKGAVNPGPCNVFGLPPVAESTWSENPKLRIGHTVSHGQVVTVWVPECKENHRIGDEGVCMCVCACVCMHCQPPIGGPGTLQIQSFTDSNSPCSGFMQKLDEVTISGNSLWWGF